MLEETFQLIDFSGFKASLPVRGQIMVDPNLGIDCFIFRRPCFSGSLKPASRMIAPYVAQESINKQVFFFLKVETVYKFLGTGRNSSRIFFSHLLEIIRDNMYVLNFHFS